MREQLQQISIWALPVLAAIVFHEVAHGVAAYRLGDSTAARAGRLTLNPLAHIDPVGTVLLPLFLILSGSGMLFGWAKPVPVNYGQLHNPKRDMVLVAAAGPAMNLLLAMLAALVLHGVRALRLPENAGFLAQAVLLPVASMAQCAVFMNVFLCVFNLLPIPPLDGGRVLTGLLPVEWARQYAKIEPFGFPILLLLMMTHSLGHILGAPIRVLLQLLV